MTTPSLPMTARERQALIAWFLRRDEGGWSTTDEAAFQVWLERPGNRLAYARWEADWRAMDALPADVVQRLRAQVAADRHAAAPGRPARRRQTAGLALAGVTALAVGGGWLAWREADPARYFTADFSTARGMHRDERLPDGSQLQLDTATDLSVRFDPGLRRVALRGGQAGFEVRSDPTRPFEVEAGEVRVRVVGTRFTVRLTPEVPGRAGVEVAVAEGRVRVARLQVGHPTPETLELGAGQALVFGSEGQAPRLSKVAADAVQAWRGPLLSFSDVPLQQALAEMGRHGDLEIARVDPDVAQLRLTGTFDPRNPAATRRVLAGALPIRWVDAPTGRQLRALR